eukprot:TRINITY_DN2376_c0_g1_i1.p1 TRINITY_DN2376_c0_g1~~TRINITY_DN2376_c0_g1_i1.p1  ORF type:complete len:387 (-),score=109.74 TRINITY_DN2376_c0_g1_i1:19-1179(-)
METDRSPQFRNLCAAEAAFTLEVRFSLFTRSMEPAFAHKKSKSQSEVSFTNFKNNKKPLKISLSEELEKNAKSTSSYGDRSVSTIPKLVRSGSGVYLGGDRKNRLLRILADPVLHHAFRLFMRKNLSEENLSFWLDIESFKHTRFSSDSERQKVFNIIKSKYVGEGSELTVNADICSQIKSSAASNPENILMLETAQREIFTLMEMDSLHKFLCSDLYKKASIGEFEQTLSNGQHLARDVLSEALDCITSFVKAFAGEEAATKLEKQIYLVAINVSLLHSKKYLGAKDMGKLRQPLHHLCDKVIDSYEIPFSFNPDEISLQLKGVQTSIKDMLLPRLSEEIVKELDKIFDVIKNEDLLSSFFEKKKWKETEELAGLLRKLWDKKVI